MTLSRPQVIDLIKRFDLRSSRALGQNFVADPNTVRRIARLAEIGPGSNVAEIGAGLGSLTLALAETGASVTAVELDRRLADVLRGVVEPAGVRVIEADALALDWPELLEGASYWDLVANLPYNVAVPLVVSVLERAPSIERMLVMVQREVGERMAAGPGEAAYGAVSVKLAYWAEVRVLGSVPPSVFIPKPKVDSALVRLVRRPHPAVDPELVPYGVLSELVQAGFSHRRKMLRRALGSRVDLDAYELAGVRPEARAEDLSVHEWGKLASCSRPGTSARRPS